MRVPSTGNGRLWGLGGRRYGKEAETEDEEAYVTVFSKAGPTNLTPFSPSLIIILAVIYRPPIICQTLC